MKIAIFYFTGTGNNLRTAEKLKEELGETVIFPFHHLKEHKKIDPSFMHLIFCVPFYYSHIPPFVRECLENVEFTKTQQIVTIVGCAGNRGRATEDICRICSEMTGRVEASFVIDSLEYLQKGGRCTALAAFGANLLKLKPCIEVIDGKMTPTKKYRGTFEKVIQHYVEDRLSGRDDIDKTRIFITHTRCDEALAAAVRDTINRVCPGFGEIIETTAGSTITSHCGPNTLGVLFVRRDNG